MIKDRTSTNLRPPLPRHDSSALSGDTARVQPDFEVHSRPPDERKAPGTSQSLQLSLVGASPSLVQ